MRVPAEVKELLRKAAEARGVSLTQFAVEPLSTAAERVLDGERGERRLLGWAVGTAVDAGDIVHPAVEPDEWGALGG